jgi:hypothetical protein
VSDKEPVLIFAAAEDLLDVMREEGCDQNQAVRILAAAIVMLSRPALCMGLNNKQYWEQRSAREDINKVAEGIHQQIIRMDDIMHQTSEFN